MEHVSGGGFFARDGGGLEKTGPRQLAGLELGPSNQWTWEVACSTISTSAGRAVSRKLWTRAGPSSSPLFPFFQSSLGLASKTQVDGSRGPVPDNKMDNGTEAHQNCGNGVDGAANDGGMTPSSVLCVKGHSPVGRCQDDSTWYERAKKGSPGSSVLALFSLLPLLFFSLRDSRASSL